MLGGFKMFDFSEDITIEDVHGEPLDSIISRNQAFLGKPISSKTTFMYDLLASQASNEGIEESMAALWDYVTLNGEGRVIEAEQLVRLQFYEQGIGTPKFVAISHSPECSRDLFVTSNSMDHFLYVEKQGYFTPENEEL